jgi:twitching motility protein PilT
VRQTLASSLRGVVSQRLLDRADGNGRIPATEVLLSTPRVVEYLRSEDSLDSLEQIVSAGEYYGMQTFDQSLFALCRDGYVSFREAIGVAAHTTDFEIALQKAGVNTSY